MTPAVSTPPVPSEPATRTPGFSLVEILAAIVVLGILISIAAPEITELTRRIELDGAAQQLVGDLERARSEAIKRNRSVRVTFADSMYTVQYVGARAFDGAKLDVAPDSIRFAPFGPPELGAATFVLRLADRTKTVRLSAAGRARVE